VKKLKKKIKEMNHKKNRTTLIHSIKKIEFRPPASGFPVGLGSVKACAPFRSPVQSTRRATLIILSYRCRFRLRCVIGLPAKKKNWVPLKHAHW